MFVCHCANLLPAQYTRRFLIRSILESILYSRIFSYETHKPWFCPHDTSPSHKIPTPLFPPSNFLHKILFNTSCTYTVCTVYNDASVYSLVSLFFLGKSEKKSMALGAAYVGKSYKRWDFPIKIINRNYFWESHVIENFLHYYINWERYNLFY